MCRNAKSAVVDVAVHVPGSALAGLAAYLLVAALVHVDGWRAMASERDAPHYHAKMLWVTFVALTWPTLPFWGWWARRRTRALQQERDDAPPDA